ncbi:MAG: DUF1932 domain-containing protein [Alphaproteobacteria bacterium]|nr:DUF1932 domain-containing protein [Alphaproteobacteria bacterium]
MGNTVLMIGFGEAGQAIASGWRDAGMDHTVLTYDTKLDDPLTRDAMHAAAVALDTKPVAHVPEAAAEVSHAVSVVTADQALHAAERAADILPPGAVFWDMNSVAPDTKRQAARTLAQAGLVYLDVGVLSPIHPKRHAAPLAVAGVVDDRIRDAIDAFGFDADVLSGTIGDAASLKLLRSIIIKGMESLLVECHQAGERAGLTDEVLQSLAPSFPGIDWPERLDYVLQRVEQHGPRRAAEMAEAVKFLDDLGVPPLMSSAASKRLSLGTAASQSADGGEPD